MVSTDSKLTLLLPSTTLQELSYFTIMLPINNNDREDYQTVLKEQAPLVCDDSVENKSLNTRPAMLLSIGFALFAVVATAGHVSRVSSKVSNLEADIAAHQSQLQAVALRDTSLLGSAFAPGSLGLHERCDGHGDCASEQCKARGYAQCEEKLASVNRNTVNGANTRHFLNKLHW